MYFQFNTELLEEQKVVMPLGSTEKIRRYRRLEECWQDLLKLETSFAIYSRALMMRLPRERELTHLYEIMVILVHRYDFDSSLSLSRLKHTCVCEFINFNISCTIICQKCDL